MLDSPFGVLEFLSWDDGWSNYKYRTHEDIEKTLALMRQAQVGWVRMDFLWQDIEPQQGEWKFEKYDYLVQVLRMNNIRILAVLGYSADWASASGEWNSPPRDDALFVEFSQKVAQRYKATIKHWEIWNEPDSPVYWSEQDGLMRYCRLLKGTYRALKSIDPQCAVLHGGFAKPVESVGLIYEHGAKEDFDILNIHIFQQPLNEYALGAVTGTTRFVAKNSGQYGDAGKAIWVTEIGCPGMQQGVSTNNWWLGENTGECAQAQWVKAAYRTLLKEERVEKIFWAFFRDCKEHWSDGTDYLGLVRWDFSPKPAFKAFAQCVEEWRKGE